MNSKENLTMLHGLCVVKICIYYRRLKSEYYNKCNMFHN